MLNYKQYVELEENNGGGYDGGIGKGLERQVNLIKIYV